MISICYDAYVSPVDMRKQISSTQLFRIGDALKQARLNLGLTQRALGERVRLPQSHISKIEQGGVDLQLSSLTELARALELEVQLVPRQALPAVEGVVRSVGPAASDRSTARALAQIALLTRLADQFQSVHPDLPSLRSYRDMLEELTRQRFEPEALLALQRIVASARKLAGPSYIHDERQLAAGLVGVTRSLRDIRNIGAHSSIETRQLPAHSLEDDEDD